MTLMLFVGFADAGLTAGGSTRRGKPLPLPLTVGSTQSPTGIAGPVYGYVSSTTGAACTQMAESALSSADATAAFIMCVMGVTGEKKVNCYRRVSMRELGDKNPKLPQNLNERIEQIGHEKRG